MPVIPLHPRAVRSIIGASGFFVHTVTLATALYAGFGYRRRSRGVDGAPWPTWIAAAVPVDALVLLAALGVLPMAVPPVFFALFVLAHPVFALRVVYRGLWLRTDPL